jgi:hypothetical protein
LKLVDFFNVSMLIAVLNIAGKTLDETCENVLRAGIQ